MKNNQKIIVLIFILLSVLVSTILPIYLMTTSVGLTQQITTRASAAGSINLTVSSAVCGDGICDSGLESCSDCAADCGSCAVPPSTPGGDTGGGGGGGGGRGTSAKHVTHMLDYRINDWYVLTLYKDDKVITVFSDDVFYKFDVTELIVYDHMTLKLEESGVSYLIKWNEKGSFDFDNNGENDLEISFLNKQVKWLNLGAKIEEPTLLPTFEKEPYKIGEGVQLGKVIKRFDFIVLIIAILIIGLAIFIYHQIKIHTLEKTYTKQISRLSKEHQKKAGSIKREERNAMKSKLEKQKKLLKEAYSSKYISRDAYEKGMSRLNDLLRKT